MHKPIKISYLIDTIISDKAGTEKQLLEIIRRLDRKVFEPSLVCLSSSPWMEKNALPCPFYDLRYKGFINTGFPGVLLRLARYIQEQDISIVQTFFEEPIMVAIIGAKLARKKPILLSSRRDIGLGQEHPWYHSIFKVLRPYVNRGLDGIVVNS